MQPDLLSCSLHDNSPNLASSTLHILQHRHGAYRQRRSSAAPVGASCTPSEHLPAPLPHQRSLREASWTQESQHQRDHQQNLSHQARNIRASPICGGKEPTGREHSYVTTQPNRKRSPIAALDTTPTISHFPGFSVSHHVFSIPTVSQFHVSTNVTSP